MYVLTKRFRASRVLTTTQFFAIEAFEYIRQHNPHNAKVITWYPASMTSFFPMFSRDLVPEVEAEVARTGKPFDVVASEVLH